MQFTKISNVIGVFWLDRKTMLITQRNSFQLYSTKNPYQQDNSLILKWPYSKLPLDGANARAIEFLAFSRQY